MPLATEILARFADWVTGGRTITQAMAEGKHAAQALRAVIEISPDRLLKIALGMAAPEEPIPTAEGIALPEATGDEAIRLAMQHNRKIVFDYTRKSDGATLHYMAAPYSFRDGKYFFYATEGKHGPGQIHSFITDRMRNVELRADAPFAPRWPTEPETV